MRRQQVARRACQRVPWVTLAVSHDSHSGCLAEDDQLGMGTPCRVDDRVAHRIVLGVIRATGEVARPEGLAVRVAQVGTATPGSLMILWEL